MCKVPLDWVMMPSVCLYDWQTLIAGFAAVLVAGITVHYLRMQIEQADRVTKEEGEARLNVARAKAIVPSSILAEHARHCMAQLELIEPAVFDRARVADPIGVLPLPLEVQTSLDALLANSRDRNTVFAASAVYGEQQVLAARASDMHVQPRSHVASFDYYCMQPVIMHALAISLLAYARRDVAFVEPITWTNMSASLNSLVSPGARRDRLLKFISDKV